jgi:hypothetical protein
MDYIEILTEQINEFFPIHLRAGAVQMIQGMKEEILILREVLKTKQ